MKRCIIGIYNLSHVNTWVEIPERDCSVFNLNFFEAPKVSITENLGYTNEEDIWKATAFNDKKKSNRVHWKDGNK